MLNEKYDYNQPGSFEMAYRVPDNLFGKTLREASMATQSINSVLMKD